MKKPSDYVESGVPYENRTLYSVCYANSNLTIEEHLAKFMQLLDTTLRSQIKDTESLRKIRKGSGAKRVRNGCENDPANSHTINIDSSKYSTAF